MIYHSKILPVQNKRGCSLNLTEKKVLKELYEQGKTPTQIAIKLGRDSSSIYYHLRQQGMELKKNRKKTEKVAEAKRPEYISLSSLPDTQLFKHINWAIP